MDYRRQILAEFMVVSLILVNYVGGPGTRSTDWQLLVCLTLESI